MSEDIQKVEASVSIGAYLVQLGKKLMQPNQTAKELQALHLGFFEAAARVHSLELELSTVREGVRELKDEIASLKDWSAEAEKYVATEIASGVFVMLLQGSEPPFKNSMKLCCNCFADRKKSILQYLPVEVGRMDSLVCPRCKATLVFRGWKGGPPVKEHVPVLA